MPYIFVEELEEGQEAAEVYGKDEYDQLKADYDNLGKERDELSTSIESLGNENKGLQQSLDDAKKKFAQSFLDSIDKPMKGSGGEPAYHPATIESLFEGVNDNA